MKYLRLRQPEHELELFLAGMAGDVGARDRVVKDVGAGLEQVVDGPATHSSLPGMGVAETMTVSPGWISTKRWSLFAMRARPAIGSPWAPVVVMTSLSAAMSLMRSLPTMFDDSVLEVAEVGGDPEVLLHRPADDRGLAAHVRGGVEHLLEAGDVAREGGHDHAAVERLHDLAERLADDPLGRRIARVLGARGVRQEAHTPSSPSRARMWKSDSLPSTGVWSNLKSPVWTTVPHGRAQGDAHRVRDRVPDPERHGRERPDRQLVARLHRDQRVVVELVLLDLVAQQAAREGARVDRDARELRQHVGQAADVVLVRMGDQEWHGPSRGSP